LTKTSLFVGGLASLALGLWSSPSRAADHLDSPSFLEPTANPLADINDVYTWMTADAKSLNLIMTVSPADNGMRSFSDAVQYVFHVVSRPGDAAAVVAKPGGTETKVICSFASNTSVQCWVVQGTKVLDYVTGNPSTAAGVSSSSGKVKVHAGQHSDPFFFNLQGFRNAVKKVKSLGALPAGCPTLDSATAMELQNDLTKQQASDPDAIPVCPGDNLDCFAKLNVLGIVVQIDKSLLNSGSNTLLGVWASTHAKP